MPERGCIRTHSTHARRNKEREAAANCKKRLVANQNKNPLTTRRHARRSEILGRWAAIIRPKIWCCGNVSDDEGKRPQGLERWGTLKPSSTCTFRNAKGSDHRHVRIRPPSASLFRLSSSSLAQRSCNGRSVADIFPRMARRARGRSSESATCEGQRQASRPHTCLGLAWEGPSLVSSFV